jgi:hypothetical protein
MRYESQSDSFTLRRRALDPSLLATRHRYALPVPGRGNTARYSRIALAGFGATASQTISSTVSGAATGAKVGAAYASIGSAVSGGATAGSAVPIIGTVVGAVIGLAIATLLTKHYKDVAAMNVAEDAELSLAQKYATVAGQGAGRDLNQPLEGTTLLHKIGYGLVYGGAFPGNTGRLCFHQGCGKYPGNPNWVNDIIDGTGLDAATAMPAMVRKAVAQGVTDPRLIVSRYFVPANTGTRSAWRANTNATGYQWLVDVADMLAAKQGVPYYYGAPVIDASVVVPPAMPIVPVAKSTPTVSTLPPTAAVPLLSSLPAGYGVIGVVPGGIQQGSLVYGLPSQAIPPGGSGAVQNAYVQNIYQTDALGSPIQINYTSYSGLVSNPTMPTQLNSSVPAPVVTSGGIGAGYNPLYGNMGQPAVGTATPAATPIVTAGPSGFLGMDSNTLLILGSVLAVSFALAHPARNKTKG